MLKGMRSSVGAIACVLVCLTSAIAAETAGEKFYLLGAEENEAFALEGSSIRRADDGRFSANVLFLKGEAQEVLDDSSNVIGYAIYSIAELNIDCRKSTFSPVRRTYVGKVGETVHTEIYPTGEEGWLNSVTERAIELSCSSSKRARIRPRIASSREAFVKDVLSQL